MKKERSYGYNLGNRFKRVRAETGKWETPRVISQEHRSGSGDGEQWIGLRVVDIANTIN